MKFSKIKIGSLEKSKAQIDAGLGPASAPQNFEVDDQTDTIISLVWTAPLSDGGSSLLRYRVDYSAFGGGAEGNTQYPEFEAGPDHWSITGLTTGTRYEFRVAAETNYGLGNWSNIIDDWTA